jgi:phosphoglycerate dehydrogenase-like enzyme
VVVSDLIDLTDLTRSRPAREVHSLTAPAARREPIPLVVLHSGDGPHSAPRLEEHLGNSAEVRYATAAELPQQLLGAEVLLVWSLGTDAVRDNWAATGSLRWIHAASAGVDRLVFPGSVESDVAITNSRGVFDIPVAEYVLGLVLAYAKDLPATLALQERREWRHRETCRVAGQAAVVVGGGPIGSAITALLRAVGVRVRQVGRTAGDGVHPVDTLPDLVGDCDYLVLAAPLTARTNGLVDADLLARLPPTARLINVGRGALVVQDDLVDALRAGRLAGAALDVFTGEPLPAGHPLWELPGVIVSPHMAGDVHGWRDVLVELFADNLSRYLAGRPLRNLVDKNYGYVRSTE